LADSFLPILASNAKGSRKNNFETEGVIPTFSKERQCQKNGVRKMKLPRFTLQRGGGAPYISDPDFSDILFEQNPK
jgi:hypothetical protein